MYKKPFYITKAFWNNAFSFEKRPNKKLYVPSLKKIKSFDEIKLWREVVFEEFNFQCVLESCKGLENFYEFEIFGKKAYLFDNHNHAYFFWYLARKNNIIWDNITLYHVDEHSDMRDPGKYQDKTETIDLKKVFDFTNFFLNVWNYIVPAQKGGLIWDIVQIRNEENLKNFDKKRLSKCIDNLILNLDLDFFEPGLDFIDYDLKKRVILDIAKKSSLITISTSPFFIDQDLALRVFRDLFW